MRRIFSALLLMTSPALAAAGQDENVIIKGGPPGTNVEMPYLMAPMKTPEGKLSGYAYISLRLTAASASSAVDVRNELAFIQDAWLRDVNATSVSAGDDPTKVDIAAVEGRLLIDAKRVMEGAKKGGSVVKMVTVCTTQVADLHPKQTANLANSGDEAALKLIPKSRCEPEKIAK